MAFRFWSVFLLVVCSYPIAHGQCKSHATHPLSDAQSPCPPSTIHSVPEKNGVLRGTVVDPADAPIPAFVFVHSDVRNNKIAAQIPVRSDGTFEVILGPGLYDLFVGYTAFQPIAKVIDIKSGKTSHLKLTMKLDEKHLESVLVK